MGDRRLSGRRAVAEPARRVRVLVQEEPEPGFVVPTLAWAAVIARVAVAHAAAHVSTDDFVESPRLGGIFDGFEIWGAHPLGVSETVLSQAGFIGFGSPRGRVFVRDTVELFDLLVTLAEESGVLEPYRA